MVLALLVVATWDPVLVHLRIWLLSRLIRCVGHNDFDSFKILGTGPNSLNELEVLTFHVSVTLCHLIALESKLKHFLPGCALVLGGLFPVTLIHRESRLHFSGL